MKDSRLDPALVRKNRWTLLLLLSTFVIPFVIGHLAYTRGWYQGGQTNHGRLLSPVLDVSALQAEQQGRPLATTQLAGKWWLVYVLPRDCAQACMERVAQLRQVRRAAGRDIERLQLLLVAQEPQAAAQLGRLTQGELLVQSKPVVLQRALAQLGQAAADASHSYIMDPQGSIMLSYPAPADQQAALLLGEGMLADLKKMLKVSRIG